MSTLSEVLVKYSVDLSDFNKKMKSAADKIQDTGKKMQSAGKNMTTGLSLPLAALGTAVIVTGANFESAMSRVQAVTGATRDDMTKMTESAKQLGATTVFSASQAADAMGFLGMAGLNTEQILASMPGLLDLAAAGALDLGVAADIASNIMSGFNLNASDMGHISDILAKAAASANTSVQQMGGAMSYVAPVAAGAGLAIEEVSAAIGILSNAGIQGERAGTALRSSIAQLQNPTGQTSKALEKLGLNADDVNPSMHSLSDILRTLEGAGVDSATAMQLVGTEAGPGLIALLSQGSNSLSAFTKELENSDGAAREMAKTMNDNAKGGFKELMSAVEGLWLSFYDQLQPSIRAVTGSLTELTRWFNELSPAGKKLTLIIAGIAMALPPVILAIGTLIIAIPFLTSGIAALTTAFGALNIATGGILLLIGLLVTAGIALYMNWDKVTAWAEKMRLKVANAWYTMKISIVNAVLSMLNAIKKLTDVIPGLNKAVDNHIARLEKMVDEAEHARKANEYLQKGYESNTVAVNENALATEEAIDPLRAQRMAQQDETEALNVNTASLDTNTSAKSAGTTATKTNTAALTDEYTVMEQLTDKLAIVGNQMDLFRASTDLESESTAYLTQELEFQREKLAIVDEQVRKANESYLASVEAKGKDAEATRNLQMELLGLQTQQANLRGEIEETTKSMQEQASEKLRVEGNSVLIKNNKGNWISQERRNMTEAERAEFKRKHPDAPDWLFHTGGSADYGNFDNPNKLAPDEVNAVVKKNEWTFTPQQVGQLATMGAGGGPTTVIVELDGRQIARSTLPHMDREIRIRTGM